MNRIRRSIGLLTFWLSWPALYVYLRNSNRTRAVIVCKKEILLVKTWIGDGRFALPGGGVHTGEQLQIAVRREVAEETNVLLAEPRPLGSEEIHEHGFHYFVHFFGARLPKKPELRLQRHEISAAMWVPIASLASTPCKPEVYRGLELLNKR